MNYQRIYASIVLRAQSEYNERRDNKKKNGAYYEVHHILPKSLGGTNDKYNLAMLTAREHFICHWLLAKLYPVGSKARDKMLLALWRMSGKSGSQVENRYINARAYSSLRSEFRLCTSKYMKHVQNGEHNSQFGWHWYTNAYTGESTTFPNDPKYPWVMGRNLFHGEYNRLSYRRVKYRYETPKTHTSSKNAIKTPIVSIMNQARRQTELLWDEFHNSDTSSITEFSRKIHVSNTAIRKRFKKHIPVFSMLHPRKGWKPNRLFIGVYVKDLNRPEA